ncbi:MAG: class II fructose-bisphosphate aldolase [Saccharofermentanales bacterium]|jgi:fructose-bisphosphate aldolase class II
MSLVRVKDILRMADEAKTSVIAYICIDYNMIYSVIKTAEKLNTPALCMLLPEHVEQYNTIDFESFAVNVKNLAKTVKVPIGLHLDHSFDYKSIVLNIKNGFPSVMIDGSELSFEDNICLTKKVVDIAHCFDVDVEGEVGHVASSEISDEEMEQLFTDPSLAAEFCERTGVDSLAISIGNAHGVYRKEPRLDISRLEEINAATDTPLVLHGGSGIPDEQLKEAFRKGINKFNVGTEFLGHYLEALSQFTNEFGDAGDPLKMLDIPMYVQEKLQDYLVKKFQLCKF